MLYGNEHNFVKGRTIDCGPEAFTKYKFQNQDVKLCILHLGVTVIVVGLVMWDYRTIVAVGVKHNKLAALRILSIEIGDAITAIIVCSTSRSLS